MKQNIHVIIAILLGNVIIWLFIVAFTDFLMMQMLLAAPLMGRTKCVINPYHCYLKQRKLKVVDLREDIPNRMKIE